MFVIDDNVDAITWQRWLADARSPDGRRFALAAEIAPTARAARARLQLELRKHRVPDLVVVDQVLSDGVDRGPDSGLGLMRWIAEVCHRAGVPTPPSVLWSASFTEQLAYAFRLAGGTQAYSRAVPARRFLASLWDIVDGGTAWEGTPSRYRLQLSPSVQALLPYLEADMSTDAIARGLLAEGLIGPGRQTPTGWVQDKRSKLIRTCNRLVDEMRGNGDDHPYFLQGQSVALADFAWRHGQRWVSLRLRPTVDGVPT